MRAMERTTGDPRDVLRPYQSVVVRYRLTSPDPLTGAHLTDAVGVVAAADASTVVVRTRTGEVTIPLASVTAARVVARRPPADVTMSRLERVMVPAWGALERHRIGGWYLRASRGYSYRGNSLVPAGDPGLPLEAALEEASTWLRARRLPLRVAVPGPLGTGAAEDPVGAAVLARGGREHTPVIVMTASTDEVASAASREPRVVGIRVTSAPDEAWMAAHGRSRPLDPRVARRVLLGSPDQAFVSVVGDGHVVATGRLGIGAGWGGFGAVWVDPERRRDHLGLAVAWSLADAAASRGIRSLHLQVEEGNVAARALWERVGFAPHHRYSYAEADR